jgi:hypothetical protein
MIEVTGTAFDVGWSTAGERLELSLHDGGVLAERLEHRRRAFDKSRPA